MIRKIAKAMDFYIFSTDINFETVERLMLSTPENDFDLYFTTQGGDPYASIFLGNYLRKNNYLKNIICVGEVNSGGNIVLSICKGAKPIKAYPYVTFSLHTLRMHLNEITNPKYVSNIMKASQNLNNLVLNIYQEKLDLTKDEMLLLQNGDNLIFNAETALKKGLIDEIIKYE